MGPTRFVGEGSEAPYHNLQGPPSQSRHPFKLARVDAELKVHRVARMTSSALRGGQLAGEYGLCNKHEIWRILLVFPWMRRAGYELLKLKDKDRFFKASTRGLLAIQTTLIRRLVRIGVLDEDRVRPYCVLALKSEEFLDRRLHTQVFKSGFVNFTHHARVLTPQRHVYVSKQIMNVLSFVVHLDSRKPMDFALTSPCAGGPKGCVHSGGAAAAARKHAGREDEDVGY